MSITEATSTVDIYIASAQTQGEKVLAAEVVRLRASNAELRKNLAAVFGRSSEGPNANYA